ncbi:DNA polymerase I [Desulfocurvus sp. DL9XJH121]
MSLKDRLGLDKDPVFLVDGHAFLYRFFYAYGDMRRSDGFPTNAIYMFLRMLFGLVRDEDPVYAGFFFDGKGKTFRHEMFTPYKAQRPAMPEDLAAQSEPVRRAVEVMGFPVTVSENVEADDCIAALAARLKTERPVVIVGADKDLKQCLDEGVYLWDPGSKKESLTSLADFNADTGLTPEQWPDFQALIGDSADNIPGVPKIGPKTAVKIMEQFPTLEELQTAVVEGRGDFTKSVRRQLETHLGDAFLYRKLTRLDLTACAGVTLADLRRAPADHGRVQAFLEEYEFRTLLRELPRVVPPGLAEAPAPEPPKAAADKAPARPAPAGQSQGTLFDMSPVTSPAPEADIRRAATAGDLPDLAGRAVGLVPAEGGFYLGLDGEEHLYTGPAAALAPALAKAASVAAPDVKSLLRADAAWWAVPEAAWFDLGLAAYLLSPEDRSYSWEHLSRRLAPEVLEAPVAGQGNTARAMAEALRPRLESAGLGDLMRDLETPLIPVLARMEERGVRIDQQAMAAFLDEVSRDLEGLTAKIYEGAGREFNLRSSQQMAEVLFTDLGLKPRGKTPGGVPSTSFAVLEKIKADHPVVADIQAWRKLEKMRSTYLEPLPRAAGPDGRIHAAFNQLATATGRLSSSGPNMQNIPIRSDMGLRMRACFTADPGNLLVGADYSQIELRVLAHFSAEPTLLDAFRQGQDIHARTAALIFDTAPGDVTRAQRGTAKTINFGLIYGMGPQKLAADLGIKLAEAKEFIARYFERLAGLKAFYESVEAGAREHGFVTTLAGRRRLLPDINSRNQNLQAQARRQAINTLIQGSAADLIKLAMLAVDRDEELAALDAGLILQVHDELLLEAPEKNARAAARRLEEIMARIYDLTVPLAVDHGVGATWAEAH